MGISELTGSSTSDFDSLGNGVIQILSILGSGLAVIFLIALGIKYMMGSIEERAEYKKTLMPYFIGAICVFSASSIAGIIYNMFK